MKVSNTVAQGLNGAKLAERQMDQYTMRAILLRSERGIPLAAISTFPEGVGIVTVELYVKWYALYVTRRVQDEFIVEAVEFPTSMEFCKSNESAFVDHVPNPRVVARWAEKSGYIVDELAMELMVGRWEIESRDNYNHVCILPEPPPKVG